MLKRWFAALMLLLAVGTIAGCTSHPQDRGDVTGENESNTNRAD